MRKLKIINFLVCQVVPLGHQNKPIKDFDEGLSSRAETACNQLAMIGQAKSWPRVLLLTSERFSHLEVAKDKSLSGYSVNLYAVNDLQSRFVKAFNKLHIASSPVNESFGHYLAMKLLEDVLEAIYDNLVRNGITEGPGA